MTETLYAAITASGTVERVVVADPNAADLQAVLTAVTPTGGNAIDVTAVSPQPGAGWAYTAAARPAAQPPPRRQFGHHRRRQCPPQRKRQPPRYRR